MNHILLYFCVSVSILCCECVKPRVRRYDRGQRAKPMEWPWQVLIITGELDWNICGGSIISENWVLTAAHCLRDIIGGEDPMNFGLIFGDHDRFEEDGSEVRSGVKKIFLHPAYETQNHTNDVALIELKTPLNFSSSEQRHLKPACLNLWPIDFRLNRCVGTGWGRRGNKGPMAEVLQKLDLIEYSHKNCEAIHAEFYSKGPSYERVGTNQICMVTRINPYPFSGVSFGAACAGDSGGPLQCKIGNTWYQIGVAWSNTHCEQNPSVYNLVDKYASWIKAISRYTPPPGCVKPQVGWFQSRPKYTTNQPSIEIQSPKLPSASRRPGWKFWKSISRST